MKKTDRFKNFLVIGISVMAGVILSPILYCGQGNQGTLFLNAKADREPTAAAKSAITIQKAFEEVYENVSPSVVLIATEGTVNVPQYNDPFQEFFYGPQGRVRNQKRKVSGLGSGFILNKEGYILTNDHVVRGFDKFKVVFKNVKEPVSAKLIGSDQTIDVALLKVEANQNLQPIEIGDSSAVKVGDWAIAIGAPFGLEQSMTVGVISKVGRGGIDNSGVHYIQTDAAINQGNSGGPLLDINGRVVGINRMIVSPSGGSIGLGFAIPINEAKTIVEELKSDGKIKRARLGVALDDITEETAKELKLSTPEGAFVRQVQNGSAAAEAGIDVDDVILEIEGAKIKNASDVVSKIRASKVGQRISILVFRKGQTLKISVKLAE
ncbi:PDZ domain-containing protein [Leptospira wolffii]|uniref:trypsin-like peptidase domain-containing protein n=1 Tax=Leptospira wolffii TaxID=409998 RepID=UPI0010845E2E|nr:trypsin-like peptidase domain-containing protein [Leptospira wolffii]TGK64862.1 PDZ domain-containing protein [Leptospira wolffii]TGK76739.1 PDZ domain-containing protein [Leptospira wolffii]TGK77409.1 PDZ domain-containing protein [Leptospira wolffii]TGL26804.1 PDZ domain-containing protein [Leptospira wolffii]